MRGGHMKGSLMTTEFVDQCCNQLAEVGCVVERNEEAGTVVAKDGSTVVLRAIHKGEGQPWLAIFYGSDRIHWN
jgi:hypothetical protein